MESMSDAENTSTRLERTLAFLSLSIIAIAVISFFATLVAGLLGVTREELASGLWPVVTWVSYVGLPVGFVLMITLILLTRRRRSRAMRSGRAPAEH